MPMPLVEKRGKLEGLPHLVCWSLMHKAIQPREFEQGGDPAPAPLFTFLEKGLLFLICTKILNGMGHWQFHDPSQAPFNHK